MSVLDRSTLPEEFYDITSAMMLVQPEPQYLHARLGMASIMKDLSPGSSLGLPGRTTPVAGAPVPNLSSMQLMLADPVLGESIKAVVELGKGPGHTIRMNRPSFANSTYTLASREINSSSSISTTPISISSEQTSITLKQLAGPYSSEVQPYAVNSFDAKLSVHKLVDLVGLNLVRDYQRTFDHIICSIFDLAATTVYAGGATGDTDMLVAEDHPMDVETLWRVEEALANAHIPRFANGQYVCILWPRQIRQLKSDAQFARLAKPFPEANPLFQSAIARVGKLDIYESTTLNTNASTTTVYKGQAFGPGMVGLGVGGLPRVLASTDDNYGLQQKVIWEAEMGFQCLDNRFGVSIHSN